MKKKFVLTLALVLMVAATIVAAPLEVSGDFKAGYKFTFTDPIGVTNAMGTDTGEGEIYNVSFTGDFWKVKFSDLNFTDAQDTAATATIYLDKALAAEGVDMGDVTLALSIGNTTTFKPSDVYSDSNDAVKELEMNGTKYTSSATIGYGSLATLQLAADLADTANKPVVVGVTTTPVDGIKAGFGYSNYAKVEKDDAKVVHTSAGITGSVCVDVAALADLDLGLTLSAIDVYFFKDSVSTDAVNRLYVEANASYEDVAAWVEYQMLDKVNNLKANVSYSGVENVGLSAYVALSDLTKKTTDGFSTEIGATADYTLGGVKYALDAAYVIKGNFTLTPSVSISF